jgi:hypothetical protein
VKIEFSVFLVVKPCSVVVGYQRFGRPVTSTLTMEAARSYETVASNHHTTQHNNPDNHKFCFSYRCLLCIDMKGLGISTSGSPVRLFYMHIWGCIQKFPDWPPGARTANGTALCHLMQLYRYFVSQSSKFCRHNTLCCFSTRVSCCSFRHRLCPETFRYTLVYSQLLSTSGGHLFGRVMPWGQLLHQNLRSQNIF